MYVKKLTLKSSGYPESLSLIAEPPEQLFVLGDLDNLIDKTLLAVVGSRKITPYGREVTKRLTEIAARAGVVIVSGLALGADSVAHQAALDAGGKTIAVLPCGLDRVYPASHYHLAQNIVRQGGALISEYPPQTEPYPTNFIARNRIVSGISEGVLITEAAQKSGTLHTAAFALEQGKTVMAVPGNINSPNSHGTNNLIKSGALAVTDIDDILLALGIDKKPISQTELFGSNEAETIILRLIQSGVSDATILLTESRLSAAIFSQTLTMLEISGYIQPIGGGHWSLK